MYSGTFSSGGCQRFVCLNNGRSRRQEYRCKQGYC